ncbi:hypothetical protein J0A68_18705 [Algoriphagus sp. H41]|uniref:Uncharacterized protein n=1 Tax=Algoriphagus oliviformis TaxID=2811231 RepID=A0ABS3CBI4_9BACT|nr:hypothetical protein [Algoriphagus oliviformis]MBN7812994.1 hypothetical protein [Algoriphagus oliviformis]
MGLLFKEGRPKAGDGSKKTPLLKLSRQLLRTGLRSFKGAPPTAYRLLPTVVFPKVCRFFTNADFGQKGPFSDKLGGFLLQLFLEGQRINISPLIHFCSVADENVRDLKIDFFANPGLECPEAIFCMAQPLAQGGQPT